MSLLHRLLPFLGLWMLPTAMGFGLQPQHSSNGLLLTTTGTSQSPLLLHPRHQQFTLFGPLAVPWRHSSFHTRSSRSMKPFWKSSSSDNEKNSSDDDSKEEEEDVPKLPSEEASVLPTGSEIDSVAEGLPPPTTNIAASTTGTPEREGILDLIDDVGQSFKPMAEKATAKGYQAETQTKKVLYAIKACAYYMLFILYRAYRGLFILVPAVFRQVYRKMELAMNSSDLTLEGDNNITAVDASATTPDKMTWRTRVTVSILALVVTLSYVFGATFKMVTKFVRTVSKSRSFPKSFEAAADELVTYEDRVGRIGKINGDTNMEPGGFAP